MKILIIDDDVELCEETEEILVSEGHKVDMVHSVEAGIQVLSGYNYDVILLDLKVPGDGFGILARKDRLCPGARVLVVTASSIAKKERNYDIQKFDSEKLRLLKTASAVFFKPYNIENLLQTINQ